jgi:hypothetical protein
MKKILGKITCVLVCFLFLISNNLLVIQALEEPLQQVVRIVETVYETEYAVIADIIATEAPYFADPTGQRDATTAIQTALNDCQAAGGGTVFLPVGEYLVSSGITVPAFVTLHGDWQDPDLGNEYGTIIIAAVESSKDDLPALFTVMGSAGTVGLTVYYPKQSIDDVKPYPYTFYVPGRGYGGYMLQSIINCTVINGYKGIGACFGSAAHEMLTVENFKGCFLFRGADVRNQADVGNWTNVVIDNRFWAHAGERSAPLEAINEYTRKNAEGFVFADFEWTQFLGLSVSERKTGIKIIKGKRIDFAGSLYNVEIRECDIGILVEAIDERWGMLLAESYVFGSEHSIVNKTHGVVKTVNVELAGGKKIADAKYKDFSDFVEAVRRIIKQGIRANRKFICEKADLPKFEAEQRIHKPAPNLFVFEGDKTGATDISANLQAILDQAGALGGIVYLPAGKYLLGASVNVPTGVELRGNSSVATRDQTDLSLGTIILADFGYGDEEPGSTEALINLEGNSGIRGLRIIYPHNSPTIPGALGKVRKCSFAVRGHGRGVYLTNSSIVAAHKGIDFRGCDNHHIKRFVGCCYDNAITVGNCENGLIEDCLQNGNAITRNALNLPYWPNEGDDLFPYIFNAVTRPNAEFIRLEKANKQKIINCFAYGVKSLINNAKSSEVLAINIGADNIGGTMLITKGGSATIVNMMRWNGKSFFNNYTMLNLQNRLTIDDRTERNFKSKFISGTIYK